MILVSVALDYVSVASDSNNKGSRMAEHMQERNNCCVCHLGDAATVFGFSCPLCLVL